ncbi:HEAT repeat domain-containing protein [Tahibacter amnicola]|uniref:HEAT repeat domain-containing protein n=1 Tax=Tahibacter amnicola TaxID=2976241 RepID=A0ABY6B6Q5_9GAMM|nr:HEAT repeat domain-containing protein [Tahibacter amnicola]UXI65783.1 HEAT repeat domain-containing protein [Tahibacter amnicola]
MLGEAAQSVGPQVLEHLKSEDLDDRAYAATVLGMIGYRPATPELIAATKSEDWRLVLVSVNSLGWLNAVEARPDVQRIARTHSLETVRRQAIQTLEVLDGRRTSVPNRVPDPQSSTGAFSLVEHPFGTRRNACPNGPWRWNGRVVEVPVEGKNGSGTSPQTPSVTTMNLGGRVSSLKVPGGRLVGNSQGEWGGGLYFETDGKEPQTLYERNVDAIVRGPDGVVAIGGLAHLTSDSGFVVAVERTANGYAAAVRLALTSAPERVVPIDASALLISTNIVNLVLRPGWQLEEASCAADTKGR